MMDKAKQARLEAAGWEFGDAKDFLGLSDDEAAFIDLKLSLASFLRELRSANGWTQAQVAERLGSSQSRVAKMEAADSTVTIDLLVKALLALGATRSDVGRVIATEAA
jgi:predicted XRE-type DNA-binding protein